MKDSVKSTGPIAAILPMDLERLRESVPILASTLAKSAGKLFEDPEEQSLTSEVRSDDPSPTQVRKKKPTGCFAPSQNVEPYKSSGSR
jgi:hypothetical protein